MFSFVLRAIAAATAAWLVVGCATVITGTTQSIAVSSEPSGADCTLTRDGELLGTVQTPGLVTVKRNAKPIQVVCKKDAHDDGNSTMEPKFESSSAGNLIVGGLVGVMVDAASGANSRYDSYVAVQLTAMSPVAQAAAAQLAARSKTPSSSSASPHDGDYEGDVELVQRVGASNFRRYTRHIEVRVVDGIGKGTVQHPLCTQPGDLDLVIDSKGQVKGTANAVNTNGCVPSKATLEGRVDGKDLRLTVIRERFEGWSTDFSLVRKPPGQTSEAGPPTGSRN